MKLSKNRLLLVLATLVVLGIFNAISFAAPFTRGRNFWLGYGFSTLAVLLAAGMTLYALDREGIKSRFYGIPILYVTLLYLPVQLATGFVFMSLPFIPVYVTIITSALLLGLCLLGLIAVEAGNTELGRIDREVGKKVFYIKSLQSDIEGLAAGSRDGGLKKILSALAETIRYSDPMSSPELAGLEGSITEKAGELGRRIGEGGGNIEELCGELRELLAERNRRCKLLK
jgi:hypothetical protein